MVDAVEIGDVVLTVATNADMEQLNSDMRDADRDECKVFGQDHDDLKYYDQAWAIRCDGDLLGIIGWGMFSNMTPLARNRLLLFMTTNKVWKHRKVFVKNSRPVMRYMLSQLPCWVHDVYTLPMSSYAKSIAWQTRVLGFKVLDEVEINGVKHTRLYANRNEVLK